MYIKSIYLPPGLSNSTSTATDPSYCSGSSRAETPSSSVQPSPTVNLSREYNLNIQTASYKDIWFKIQEYVEDGVPQEGDIPHSDLLLLHVWQPNRECVQEALGRARSGSLTSLVSDFFTHRRKHLLSLSPTPSQRPSRRPCPVSEIFPLDFHALTESQCKWAYGIFLRFDSHDNPFPCPDSTVMTFFLRLDWMPNSMRI